MRFLPPGVWRGVDFIFRPDADLLFGPDYLSHLLQEFARDPRLGIASGALYEPWRDGWREVITPLFHTRGPSKLYSRACFEAIGGLRAGLGWDTVDEAHALMLGFRTRTFRHIRAYHRRVTGSARGLWRGRIAAGEAAYAAGYSPVFLMARAVRHLLGPPWMLGGMLLTAGYVRAHLHGTPRLADPELTNFIRRQQLRRLTLRESVWR
jgi:hypothetical protein